jgi:hypothetical protein
MNEKTQYLFPTIIIHLNSNFSRMGMWWLSWGDVVAQLLGDLVAQLRGCGGSVG